MNLHYIESLIFPIFDRYTFLSGQWLKVNRLSDVSWNADEPRMVLSKLTNCGSHQIKLECIKIGPRKNSFSKV